ncbi:metallophosphoesterase [Desertibaculum subflavum]|uniref:metallophosphoesterase n=1 Tax=Desertibaculum subflavum TaxID=2268458 RepID=UPI0034D2C6E0
MERRIGPSHLRDRLRLEQAHEARVGQRRGLHHVENWRLVRLLINSGLRVTGLHGRGRRNALNVQVTRHAVPLKHLPASFHGFTLLHLSDLHLASGAAGIEAMVEAVRPLDYDLCVLTGDYRFRTYGPSDATLAELERLRAALKTPAYAVLGNHDSIRMVPAMEAMGYRLLLNEHVPIRRGDDAVHLAGIDDAYFYDLADFRRAAGAIPPDATSILLSHTPETYRDAAAADFDLMLCGHTHGGQICLPGGVPVLTHAPSPRRFARGSWRYDQLIGYTSRGTGNSLVDIRFNCPPEVTLHQLERTAA